MKSTELRIGNWVKYPHLIENVLHEFDSISGIFENNSVSIKSRPYTAFTLDSVNPILLTEEWLMKFGFYETSRYGKYLEFNINQEQALRLPICKHSEKDFWYVLRGSVKIQYVHQLQNLYFALTGEEL